MGRRWPAGRTLRTPDIDQPFQLLLGLFVCLFVCSSTQTGVEQLSSLQHLDLAYNLLLEHSQLAPLSLLHCLNTVKTCFLPPSKASRRTLLSHVQSLFGFCSWICKETHCSSRRRTASAPFAIYPRELQASKWVVSARSLTIKGLKTKD